MVSKVAAQSQELEEFRRKVATEREAVEEQLSEQNGTIVALEGVVLRLEDDITTKRRKLEEALQRAAQEESEAARRIEDLETRLAEQGLHLRREAEEAARQAEEAALEAERAKLAAVAEAQGREGALREALATIASLESELKGTVG